MQIRVRLFAALRERAGIAERQLELAEGASVADVWRELELGDEPPGIAYARNREYASRDTVLADGDEVALIPPVSGGGFRVTDGPLDLGALVEEVRDPSAGAIATFVGTTRDRSRGRTVTHLEYDAYPEMAERKMRQILDEVAQRWPEQRAAIVHRVGKLEVGEASVVIAVASPHRGESFEACRYVIDRVKQEVPIWKKEVFTDGEAWVEGS